MSKTIGSIDREVRLLGTHIDEEAARLVASHPDAGVTLRKVQERFVLQARDVGVSLSLFRSRAGMDAGAEVVLATWDGEVTFPGCTPRHDRHATQVSARQFRLTQCDDASWLWIDEATANTVTSPALAAMCVATMEARLPSSSASVTPEQS